MDNINQNIEIEEKAVINQIDDFGYKEEKIEKKSRWFKDLGWYFEIIKWAVLLLAFLEILTYVVPIILKGSEFIMMGIINPILLLVDFVVFGWIIWEVKLKRGRNLRHALVAVFLAGFSLGLIMSLFKFFWVRQFWTLPNLLIEPVFMGLVAIVIGLAVSLFIRKK